MLPSGLSRWSSALLSVLRIVAAFLFMAHGTQKLFGWPVSEPQPTAPLVSLMGLAGVLETFGGLLLLLGLLTQPVALVLAIEMAVAYFKAHAPRDPWPILNHGELAILYCFLFLYLAAAGSGRWSIDALLARRRGGP